MASTVPWQYVSMAFILSGGIFFNPNIEWRTLNTDCAWRCDKILHVWFLISASSAAGYNSLQNKTKSTVQ